MKRSHVEELINIGISKRLDNGLDVTGKDILDIIEAAGMLPPWSAESVQRPNRNTWDLETPDPMNPYNKCSAKAAKEE